ncbi:MAG: hypothetical protein EZS28_051780 [Streblomastix strix]|uniref:Uncharacterized protein n=1 Tax=Streblomastix strix TaxID=222440 RepID=A0A5J4T4P4_9EUKA|nr:MAG: hypothetical protein EZS28_051780 [Streblomastix strix]
MEEFLKKITILSLLEELFRGISVPFQTVGQTHVQLLKWKLETDGVVGGIVGLNNGGTIKNSINDSYLSGYNFDPTKTIEGIVGELNGVTYLMEPSEKVTFNCAPRRLGFSPIKYSV